MNKNTLGLVACVVIVAGWYVANAIGIEYHAIKTKLEATQARIDKLTDETNETIRNLNATIQDLRDVFKRFKAEQETQEIYQPPLPEELPTPKEEMKELVKPTIIMHSGKDCGPCNEWKARRMPQWINSGWDVQVVTELDSKIPWPWFEITDADGLKFEVIGQLTGESFIQARERAKK
jgi:hypothetical protein